MDFMATIIPRKKPRNIMSSGRFRLASKDKEIKEVAIIPNLFPSKAQTRL